MSKSVSDEDLNSFCSVTGASLERARFFVDAANGNLELAIESFFENGGADEAEMESGGPVVQGRAVQVEDDEEEDDADDEDYNPFDQLGGAKPKVGGERKQPARAAAKAAGKIFSLNDFGGEGEEGEESEGEQQAFYAGGSKTR